MVRLKRWQWIVLAMPIASILIFILVSAGWQIKAWGINWIWGIFILIFLGWRWLLVKWTGSTVAQVEAAVAQVNQQLDTSLAETSTLPTPDAATENAAAAMETILKKAQNDPPIWENGQLFWQRCQELVIAISHIYQPEAKYPLLNIYIPQAYGLIRGTVDDLDQWMQKLSPALNQVTVGQGLQAYEVYQKLEPSARKLWQVWSWAQWLINPAAALARQASLRYSNQATQQLLVNLGQMLREAALKNLCRQAIALYSGSTPTDSTTFSPATAQFPSVNTQTLRDILEQAEPVANVEQKPMNILLVGRTGSGKSSLINTLFQADRAQVDVLPSTDRIQNYHWQTPSGETLTLWDTPGYEQVNRSDLRDLVLDYAINADLLLLVTPALDPALQMDAEFLQAIPGEIEDLPTITIVTQVDRLRPIREWQPPYDWQWGEQPKEKAIREATAYRAESLGDWCDRVLPVVTADAQTGRTPWNIEALSFSLIDAIAPAKQGRLARFLRNLEVRTVEAAKIIDRYTFQMATTQGLTAFLKSPVLQFISTLTTGSAALAPILAKQIPVEQLPMVIGKLQMAYELFTLLSEADSQIKFDLRSLWLLLLDNSVAPDRNAWAFGQALVEYWTQHLSVEELYQKFKFYITSPQAQAKNIT